MAALPSYQDVVHFWFRELRPAQWFHRNQKLDQQITNRFQGLVEQALDANLSSWENKPSSALALVLLLDQFPTFDLEFDSNLKFGFVSGKTSHLKSRRGNTMRNLE